MSKPTFLLSLLLAVGVGSPVLAQTSSTASDSLSRRIHYLDSLETARLAQINAPVLTDPTTRASIDSALSSLATTTAPPPAAPVDTTGLVYPNANGQRLIYDTGNIIGVLRSSRYNLTAVCAHRGYFMEAGVPENSLKAIQRASDNNLEMVELDIKMSRDGVPVLSHDFTLGRTTVGGGYDLISATTSGALQRYLLRDKNGNPTQEHLPTLEQALDYIYSHRIAIVVALDIKDRTAAMACWEVVKRKHNAWNNPAYNWVIFKMNATTYGYPADLVYDFKGMVKPLDPTRPGGRWVKDFYYDKLLYVPVYTTNMVDKIDCLDSYRQFRAQPFFVAVEINYKQLGGILTNMMADIHREGEAGVHRTKVVFNAIPDATNVGPDRFWKANGYETYRLRDIYYTTKDGSQHDTNDERGDWGFLTQPQVNFHWITTDNPVALDHYLGGKNLRYTTLYRPHPDGTADEVDPHSLGGSSTANRLARTASGSAAGIYPNPTTGSLSVSLNQPAAGKVVFRVTDPLGRPVLTQERLLPAGPQQVNLPNLRASGARPGLYLLQVAPSGQPRQTYKVQLD